MNKLNTIMQNPMYYGEEAHNSFTKYFSNDVWRQSYYYGWHSFFKNMSWGISRIITSKIDELK